MNADDCNKGGRLHHRPLSPFIRSSVISHLYGVTLVFAGWTRINPKSSPTFPPTPSHPKPQRPRHHRIISTAKRTPHISLQPNTLLPQCIPIPLSNARIFIMDPAVHLKKSSNFKPPLTHIEGGSKLVGKIGQFWVGIFRE